MRIRILIITLGMLLAMAPVLAYGHGGDEEDSGSDSGSSGEHKTGGVDDKGPGDDSEDADGGQGGDPEAIARMLTAAGWRTGRRRRRR